MKCNFLFKGLLPILLILFMDSSVSNSSKLNHVRRDGAHGRISSRIQEIELSKRQGSSHHDDTREGNKSPLAGTTNGFSRKPVSFAASGSGGHSRGRTGASQAGTGVNSATSCLTNAGFSLVTSEHLKPWSTRYTVVESTVQVTPKDVNEIKSILKCSVDSSARVSALGGGHSLSAYAYGGYQPTSNDPFPNENQFVPHDLIVVSMENFKTIKYDEGTKLVQVGGGVTVSELAVFLNQKKLHIPHPLGAHIGVAGSAMGGGWGTTGRMFGFTMDLVEQIQYILADGSVKVANERENPELLYAFKGAGSSFGIVTDVWLKPVKAPEDKVTSWTITYSESTGSRSRKRSGPKKRQTGQGGGGEGGGRSPPGNGAGGHSGGGGGGGSGGRGGTGSSWTSSSSPSTDLTAAFGPGTDESVIQPFVKLYLAWSEFGKQADPRLSMRFFPLKGMFGYFYGTKEEMSRVISGFHLPSGFTLNVEKEVDFWQSEQDITRGIAEASKEDPVNPRNFYSNAAALQTDGIPSEPELTKSITKLFTSFQELLKKQDQVTGMYIDLVGGEKSAVSKTKDGESSWSHSKITQIVRSDVANKDPTKKIDYVVKSTLDLLYFTDMDKFKLRGYPNYRTDYLDIDGRWQQALYPDSYSKLQEIKKKYDPEEIFTSNPESINNVQGSISSIGSSQWHSPPHGHD